MVPVPNLVPGSAESSALSAPALHKLTRLTEGRGTIAGDVIAAAVAWGGTGGRAAEQEARCAGPPTR